MKKPKALLRKRLWWEFSTCERMAWSCI